MSHVETMERISTRLKRPKEWLNVWGRVRLRQSLAYLSCCLIDNINVIIVFVNIHIEAIEINAINDSLYLKNKKSCSKFF